MSVATDVSELMALDQAMQQPPATQPMALGVVHGQTVGGFFYQTVVNYLTYQQRVEVERLTAALRDAAAHVDDPFLAQRYRAEADRRVFQDSACSVMSGPLLSMGRGQLCQMFLESTDAPWLFMSDSDMTWDPQVPQEMVRLAEAQGIKVLGGVAWILQFASDGSIARRFPNVFKAVMHKEGEFLHPIMAEELPENELCRIGAAGAAALLVHRDVLIKVRDEICGGQPFWWHHLPAQNGDQYGEDTSFCLRVRAAGEHIYIHTGLKFGHAKTYIH